MSRPARITSIGVLETLAGAMQRFRGEAAGALDDLDIELRRALEWIHHERREYWSRELRLSWEAVAQARVQLQCAQISRRIAGHEPSCIDEKRALEKAIRRQRTAEEKVAAVQRWAGAIDRAIDEFRRSRTRFATWLDTETPQAVAALDRMSQSLESYISLETPTNSAPTAPLPGGVTEEPADEEPGP
jgi:hypothetical protein